MTRFKTAEQRRAYYRRRSLRKKELLPPAPPSVIQPGSYKQRVYARKYLNCELIEDKTWRVWGGQNPHIIIQKNNQFYCDCYCNTVEHKICTHIIKVGWFLESQNEPAIPV